MLEAVLLVISAFALAPLMVSLPCIKTCCGCMSCDAADYSTLELELVVTGATNGACGGCDTIMNKTHILPSNGVYAGVDCGYVVNFGSGGLCPGTSFAISGAVGYIVALDETRVNAQFSASSGGNDSFQYTTSGRIDCSDVSSLSLPFNASTLLACSLDSATVTATILT